MVFGRRKFTASSNETDTLQQQPIPLSDAQSLDDVGDVEEDMEQAPKPFSRVPVSAPLSPSSSQQPLSVEHYKFGITERLNDAVALKLTDSATLSFRSPDLIPLMKSFDNMRKKLRQMIATVKTYHQSMVTLDHNRLQMAKEIASFADGTPMNDKVNNSNDPLSFISVFHNTANVSAKNSFKYKNDVLAYCIEWETVVSTQVDKDVQDVKKLREMFNHYQDKVDALRKKVSVQETKGKIINVGLSEKLQRNEEKLDEASGLYESSARPLCVLIEEVVHYGYKDLYPLVVAIMKFEMERSQTESRALHLFQCDGFESECSPNRSGKVTNNLIRPLLPANEKSKPQSDSHPKNVMKKKVSNRSLSNTNDSMKRGKVPNATKSATAPKPKRPSATSAIGQNTGSNTKSNVVNPTADSRKPAHSGSSDDSEESDSSSPVLENGNASKVATV